jgi:hypothetical protein
MKDQLISFSPMYGNYIVNLQDSTAGTGTHWMLLILKRGESFYFDSYGAPMPEDVIDFAKKLNEKLAYSQFIVQDFDSQLCGYYDIGLAIYLKEHPGELRDKSNDFINMFVDDTRKNGPILKKYFANLKKKPNTFVKTRLLPVAVK